MVIEMVKPLFFNTEYKFLMQEILEPIIRTAECKGVKRYSKSRFSTCEWRYGKNICGAVFNILFAKLSILKTLFSLQASGIKTVAATKTDQMYMIFH
jgi:hypothetical protein